MADSPFKVCPNCGFVWNSRESLLADPTVVLAGYQASFVDLSAGYFLFQHERPECGTSMAVEAGRFLDLYDGPIFQEHRDERCPGFCLKSDNLERCSVPCECAFVREVLQVVRLWPKAQSCSEVGV